MNCVTEVSIDGPTLGYAWYDCNNSIGSGWGVLYGTETFSTRTTTTDSGTREAQIRNICIQNVCFLHHQHLLARSKNMYEILKECVDCFPNGKRLKNGTKLVGVVFFSRKTPTDYLWPQIARLGRDVWDYTGRGDKGPLYLQMHITYEDCILQQIFTLYQLYCDPDIKGHCIKPKDGALPLRIISLGETNDALSYWPAKEVEEGDAALVAESVNNLVPIVEDMVQKGLQKLGDTIEHINKQHAHHIQSTAKSTVVGVKSTSNTHISDEEIADINVYPHCTLTDDNDVLLNSALPSIVDVIDEVSYAEFGTEDFEGELRGLNLNNSSDRVSSDSSLMNNADSNADNCSLVNISASSDDNIMEELILADPNYPNRMKQGSVDGSVHSTIRSPSSSNHTICDGVGSSKDTPFAPFICPSSSNQFMHPPWQSPLLTVIPDEFDIDESDTKQEDTDLDDIDLLQLCEQTAVQNMTIPVCSRSSEYAISETNSYDHVLTQDLCVEIDTRPQPDHHLDIVNEESVWHTNETFVLSASTEMPNSLTFENGSSVSNACVDYEPADNTCPKPVPCARRPNKSKVPVSPVSPTLKCTSPGGHKPPSTPVRAKRTAKQGCTPYQPPHRQSCSPPQ